MGYKLKTHSGAASALKRQDLLSKVKVLTEIISLQNSLQKEKDITEV
jgi:hypothetical protein